MDNLPKREDDIYKDIEKFKEFELTDCIVYEMKIRSKEVQELIKDIITLYNNNAQVILKYLNTDNPSIYYRRDNESSEKNLYYKGADRVGELKTKLYYLYNQYKITYKTKNLYSNIFGNQFYSIFSNFKSIEKNNFDKIENGKFFTVDPDERETRLTSIIKKDCFYIKTLVSVDFNSFDSDYYLGDNGYDMTKIEKDFKKYIKSEDGIFDIGYKNEIRIIEDF